MPVDLIKQQTVDADRKAIQQINFTAHLDRAGNARNYFILKESKENILEFSQWTVKVCRMWLNDLVFINTKWNDIIV